MLFPNQSISCIERKWLTLYQYYQPWIDLEVEIFESRGMIPFLTKISPGIHSFFEQELNKLTQSGALDEIYEFLEFSNKINRFFKNR